MRKERCRDPRRIGCKRIVTIKRHHVCQRCYQWLRDHGRITCRSYIRQGEEPQENECTV